MLKRQTFGYGDSFTADDFPEAPKKDGCYADWNVTDLSDLRFDTTVTAVYRPYVTALAAGDTEDGRPALLAEGLFRTRRHVAGGSRPTPPTPARRRRGVDAHVPGGRRGEPHHPLARSGGRREALYRLHRGGRRLEEGADLHRRQLPLLCPAIGLRAVCRRSRHACRVAALGGHGGVITAIAAVITLVIRKRRAKAAKCAQ